MNRYRTYMPNEEAPLNDGDLGFDGVISRGQVEDNPPRMLASAKNLRVRDNMASTRKGVVKPGWANRCVVGDANTYPYGRIDGFGRFKDPNSLDWMLVAADGVVFRGRQNNAPYALPFVTADVLPKPAPIRIAGPCSFVQAFGKVYLFRGKNFNPLRMLDIDTGFQDLLPQWDAAATYSTNNEIAYGPFQALGSLMAVAATVTAVTSAPHGYVTGLDVVIQGATHAEYNGRFNITVVDDVTFTYSYVSAGNASAGGTPKVSDMSTYFKATSGTAAGESPTTTPSKWSQIHNILPRADDALYTNNRLLVPTWYTPLSDGFSTGNGGYTKKDFVIFTDYGDEIHFDFQNEGRINQGSADEIVGQCKFNDQTVIVFKNSSWGVLSNVAFNLTDMTLDMRNQQYGASARNSFVTNGAAVYFMSDKRGVISLVQSENSKLMGVDKPLSYDIQPEIERINWLYASKIRMAMWDNKLYVAVPLDDARGGLLNLTAGLTYAADTAYVSINVVIGQTYTFTAGPGDEPSLVDDNTGNQYTGTFTADVTPLHLYRLGGRSAPFAAPVTASVTQTNIYSGVNNALLVYDFEKQRWSGYDTGTALTVKEFLLFPYNGVDRLWFIGEDGYVNLVEESTSGDQVPGGCGGTMWEEVQFEAVTRGYLCGENGPKRERGGAVVLETWNPKYSIVKVEAGFNRVRNLQTDKTKSRTAYYRPFAKAPYNPTNVNNDAQTSDREDYSVILAGAGTALGSGIPLTVYQQTTERFRVTGTARYVQFKISNTQGNVRLKAVEFDAVEGPRRKGTLS